MIDCPPAKDAQSGALALPARPEQGSGLLEPLNILFVTGDSHFPQSFGGTQSSTDQLIRRLQRLGHSASLFCALAKGGLTEWRARLQMKAAGKGVAIDRRLGYPVLRGWNPLDHVQAAIECARPDVVVAQNWNATALAGEFLKLGVPSVIYFRSMEFADLGGDPSALEGAQFVANSEFTASQYRENFGVSCTVVRPLIDQDQYRVAGAGKEVLFINPVPQKGLAVALALAERCPDIPFRFVECWNLAPECRADLLARLATLPNVEFQRKTTGMKALYASARLVLAPSQWEEAWGRIASEAQVSGIPVLGSNRGGLPEAIGPGGVVVDHDAPIDSWVAALREIWDQPARWQALSDAARAYAQRPQLNPDQQLHDFVNVLRQTIDGRADLAHPLERTANF